MVDELIILIAFSLEMFVRNDYNFTFLLLLSLNKVNK